MFVFLALFAILNGSSATPKCTERRSINLLDCSGLHLTSLPRFRQPKIWVESLDLKRNAIVYLNFSSLTIRFPNLRRLDVRENPFDCGSLLQRSSSKCEAIANRDRQHCPRRRQHQQQPICRMQRPPRPM